MQVNTEINAVQKQIGPKKKAKEDVTDLLNQKGGTTSLTTIGGIHADCVQAELEKRKKDLLASAAEKEALLKVCIFQSRHLWLPWLTPEKSKVKTIGNLVHESVPVSNNEDNNTVERTWKPAGVEFEKRKCLSHHEVLAKLEGYDPERGVKVVGHRGYFLRGVGVFLNQYGTHCPWTGRKCWRRTSVDQGYH
jgi:seryl-tRNA synthetase